MSAKISCQDMDTVPEDDPASEEEIIFVGRTQGSAAKDSLRPNRRSQDMGSTRLKLHGNSRKWELKRVKREEKHWPRPKPSSKSVETRAVTDYVANMLIHDDTVADSSNLTLNTRDLGGHSDWGSELSSSEDIDLDDVVTDEHVEYLEAKVSGNGDPDDSEQSLPFQSAGDKEIDNGQHAMHISDAEMARLLAQQEQLGISADDLILFDSTIGEHWMPYDSEDGGSEIEMLNSTKKRSSKKSLRTTSKKRPERCIRDDEYYLEAQNFDWRHNVQNSEDTRKPLDFGLSDSELEQNLQASWKKDRLKKKDRKREREEMRALGILGRRGKENASPKSRYPSGMSFEEFKAEVEIFVRGSTASLALPPMHQHTRKAVHDVSHKLGLKSKSMGSGKERFTILYKTRKTTSFRESSFIGMEKRFMARPGNIGLKANGAKGAGRGTGQKTGGLRTATFRDGEIVGAGAPELGQDNKGRAMLEKMGWHTGIRLGADANQGIAVPVAQVVKTGKAGLG